MLIRVFFIFGLGFCAHQSWSLGKVETVMEAAVFANNEILSSPPLPILEFKKGESLFSVVAATYNIDVEGRTSADPDSDPSGDFAGTGVSLNYSWTVSKSWGYFVFATFNSLTGDFTNRTDGGSVVSTAEDAEASFYALGAGVMYNLIDGDFLTVPVFAGPLVGQMSFSATVTQSTGGSPNGDFDMESNPLMYGAIGGIQFAMKFSNYFALIPYLIVGGDFSDSCKDWEATAIRQNGPIASESSRECGGPGEGGIGGSTNNQIYLSNTIMAYGVNVAMPAYGLSIGVFAGADQDPDSENLKLTKVQLGLSF